MRAVVLTFDCLPLRLLGCHGNLWIETPHFDRLAAESVVFDQHFCEYTGTSRRPHTWWTGCHHFPRPGRDWPHPHLLDVLRSAGVQTHLLCEAPVECGDPSPLSIFNSAESQASTEGDNGPPRDSQSAEDGLPFARLIRQAEQVLRQAGPPSPGLLWLHARGAPSRQTRQQEPAEPAPHNGGDDADEREPSQIELCAKEVMRLDNCLGRLLDALHDSSRARTEARVPRPVRAGEAPMASTRAAVDAALPLLIVTAAAGRSLGEEHVLPPGRALREEIVHTPLFVRLPHVQDGSRRHDLAGTMDLAPTLLDWFGLPPGAMPCEGRSLLPLIRGEDAAPRTYLCLGDDTAWGLRTPGFSLHKPAGPAASERLSGKGAGQPQPASEIDAEAPQSTPAESPRTPQLFIKPDDPWDVNDVAAQFPDRAEAMAATLDEFVHNARTARPLVWPPCRRR